MAIGIRSGAASNWDIAVYGRTAAYPTCVQSPPLEYSDNVSDIDFVVGDFTENRAGTYYGLALQQQGTAAGLVEWSSISQLLVPNEAPVQGDLTASNVLDCYTVHLEAGIEYIITFTPSKSSGAMVALFYNAAADAFWTNRNGAVTEAAASFAYTPPATGYYGLVVTNDLGSTGTYSLGVGHCVGQKPLDSNVPLWVYDYENRFEFDQGATFWAAVGFRRPAAAPLLSIYGNPLGGVYPACMSDWIATATGAQWETAILAAPTSPDGIPHNSYYLRAPQHEEGELGRIEWGVATTQVVLDYSKYHRPMHALDVLDVLPVNLQAGVNYTFNFHRIGEADLNLLLFRNDGSPTWYERSQAVLTASEPAQYTPPDAGWYGIVVVNDNAQNGTYFLDVNTCDPPARLEAGSLIETTPGLPTEYFYTIQQPRVWSVVGALSGDDWDLSVYEHGAGGSPPLSCRDGLLATSSLTGTQLDFVVGDFNRNAPGPYYTDVSVKSGSDQASVLWEHSQVLLAVNGGPVGGSLTDTDFLDVYDLFLTAGQEYEIDFNLTIGSADAKFFLFQANGDTYWAPRASRVLESSSSVFFTPDQTGNYGVVVITDDGESGSYVIEVQDPTVAAPANPASGNPGIQAILPNPTRGAVTIRFYMAETGSARFEIVDVAGRVVATIPGRVWEKGLARAMWDGTTSSGIGAPAGVYFVRMRCAGKTREVKRFILLD